MHILHKGINMKTTLSNSEINDLIEVAITDLYVDALVEQSMEKLYDAHLNDTELSVALYLIDCCSDESQDLLTTASLIGAQVQRNRFAVMRSLHTLEEIGLIHWQRTQGSTKRSKINVLYSSFFGGLT